jgi:hypothetical protein
MHGAVKERWKITRYEMKDILLGEGAVKCIKSLRDEGHIARGRCCKMYKIPPR